MKEIITDVEKLSAGCSQISLVDEKGVNLTDAKDVIAKITAVMENNKSIVALSAPEIGINKRAFCIRFDSAIKAFVNPIITKKDKLSISHETCACMPNKEIVTVRPEDITVIYYNNDIKYEENKLLGLAARLFDQQYQILDGVLPSDLGLVSDITEHGSIADASEEELKEIYEMYKQFISIKFAAIKDAISQDSTLNEEYRHLKFTEDVINGRTQIIENPPKMNRAQRRAAVKESKRIEKIVKGK